MYRIWYWAMIDRESDGRVVASVPDLDDVAVSASTEKDALAHLTCWPPNAFEQPWKAGSVCQAGAISPSCRAASGPRNRPRHHSGRSGAHRCLAGTAVRHVAVGVDPPLTPARRPLSSMTYLLAFLAALVGAALGFALGAAAAGLAAPFLGITSFEGASGYFAVFIGGPIGGLAGLVLGALLVLRRAGHRGAAVGGRVALVFAGVVGLAAAGMAAFWLMRPLVNANGPAPRLVFEIRLPPGVAVAAPRDRDTVELQTSKNRMPASLAPGRVDDGRDVVVGSVELYYRTWQRMLVLRLPDKTDVLFELSLGLTPDHTRTFTAVATRRLHRLSWPGPGTADHRSGCLRHPLSHRLGGRGLMPATGAGSPWLPSDHRPVAVARLSSTSARARPGQRTPCSTIGLSRSRCCPFTRPRWPRSTNADASRRLGKRNVFCRRFIPSPPTVGRWLSTT